MFVKYDKIVNVNDELYHTAGSFEITDGIVYQSDHAIFVMSKEGNIYISKSSEYGLFHHSSFLSGEDVAAAGHIVIEKGTIKKITNSSGHYKPPLETVKKNMINELEARDYLFNNMIGSDNINEHIIFTGYGNL